MISIAFKLAVLLLAPAIITYLVRAVLMSLITRREGAEYYLEVLEHSADPMYRALSASFLGKVDGEEVGEALLKALRRERNAHVVASICSALKDREDEETIRKASKIYRRKLNVGKLEPGPIPHVERCFDAALDRSPVAVCVEHKKED